MCLQVTSVPPNLPWIPQGFIIILHTTKSPMDSTKLHYISIFIYNASNHIHTLPNIILQWILVHRYHVPGYFSHVLYKFALNIITSSLHLPFLKCPLLIYISDLFILLNASSCIISLFPCFISNSCCYFYLCHL